MDSDAMVISAPSTPRILKSTSTTSFRDNLSVKETPKKLVQIIVHASTAMFLLSAARFEPFIDHIELLKSLYLKCYIARILIEKRKLYNLAYKGDIDGMQQILREHPQWLNADLEVSSIYERRNYILVST